MKSMTFGLWSQIGQTNIAVVVSLLLCAVPAGATPADDKDVPVSIEDIGEIKAQLAIQQRQIAAQQEQIEHLRVLLEAQAKILARGAPVEKLGEVASTSAVVPPDPRSQSSQRMAPGQPVAGETAPLSLKIGDSYLTPIGFIDATYVGRSTNVGSGLGTNFAAIPFSNVPQGRLTDGFLTLQNSRIGARFDSIAYGAKILAYWESDFLGNQPTNILVSTNSATFRLRLMWIDVKKNKWEFLGGQSWSLITPNRRRVSPLPADVFYSHDVDTNYQVGIPWARIPTFRFSWYPTDKIAWAVAAENAQQYIGGSAGGGLVTLPANLSTPLNNVLNNGNTSYSVPTFTPDFISKLAFDPVVNDKLFHFEIAGMVRTFRIFDSLSGRHFTTVGGAGSLNANLELIKGGRLRLIENFFYGRGAGRWLFGQGPDLIVNSNGALGLLPAGGTTDGIESQVTNNLLLYAYYGGSYFGRGTAIDTNGKPVGYGFPGSPNSNNRTIQEVTGGFQNTFWRDPKWGGLYLYFQYSYLFRTPWFVAPGTPAQATTNMVFVNLRYLLPGQPPDLK